MYRPADVDNMKDFGQYYRQSFIGLLDPEFSGITTPFFIGRDVGETTTKTVPGFSLINSSPQGEPGVYKTREFNLPFATLLVRAQFGMPQFGSVIYGKSAQYISRDTPREGHRGYRSERLTKYTFGSWFFQEFGIYEGSNEINDACWYTFNPYYFPIHEALRLVDGGSRIACPISRHLTVHLDHNTITPALSYKTEIIGAFSPDLENILLSSEAIAYAPMVREITKMRVIHE